jgi:hypothetical protein
MMVVWLSAAMKSAPYSCGSAFGPDPLRPPAAAGGLGAGGLEGVGHAVVLAGLPDHRVPVVLAAVVDGHPDPQGQGGLPLPDGLAAVVAALVGRHPVVGADAVAGTVHGRHPLSLAGSPTARRGGEA